MHLVENLLILQQEREQLLTLKTFVLFFCSFWRNFVTQHQLRMKKILRLMKITNDKIMQLHEGWTTTLVADLFTREKFLKFYQIGFFFYVENEVFIDTNWDFRAKCHWVPLNFEVPEFFWKCLGGTKVPLSTALLFSRR